MFSQVSELPDCSNWDNQIILSPQGIEHLWIQAKQRGTNAEWQLIAGVTFHDLCHDFAHRARQAGWSLEEVAIYAGAGHQTAPIDTVASTIIHSTVHTSTQTPGGHPSRAAASGSWRRR